MFPAWTSITASVPSQLSTHRQRSGARSFYNGKGYPDHGFWRLCGDAPGKEGLVHISRLDVKRTDQVTDVVNVGDEIVVKVLEIDDKGRLNLSRRDALIEIDGLTPENEISDAPRGPRRDSRDSRDRRDDRRYDRRSDRRDDRPRASNGFIANTNQPKE